MKKKVFIWLDDERILTSVQLKRIGYPIYCDVVCCKTAKHCMEYLKKYAHEYPIYIEFDHDLGEKETGYDVAKFIVENKLPILGFGVHSMNPVGASNIIQLLTHYGYEHTKIIPNKFNEQMEKLKNG